MKILIVDILLKGQENSDWKEGYELYYAFKNLGYDCDIAGKNGLIPETEIPNIAHNYDLIIITENYPQYSDWNWWNWVDIKTPKLFWAIDTHLVDFSYFINSNNIDYVAFNNKKDMDYMVTNAKKIWLPYGISKKHYGVDYAKEKVHDITFIGSMNPDRQKYVSKYNMKHFMLYGPNYVREMQRSKICFNKSMSYDFNAKNMEIIGSGTFMLSNMNQDFLSLMEYNEDISKMLYIDDDDLYDKIRYYLNNDIEREEIAKRGRKYIFDNHSYEKRMEYLLKQL